LSIRHLSIIYLHQTDSFLLVSVRKDIDVKKHEKLS
jgi:hypothetical protein